MSPKHRMLHSYFQRHKKYCVIYLLIEENNCMQSHISYCVSTACFIQTSVRDINHLFNCISKFPYLDEVEVSITMAKKMDIGVEVVYRTKTQKKINRLINNNRGVIWQIHGPIFYSLLCAFKQGLRDYPKNRVLAHPLASFLLLGTVKNDIEDCKEILMHTKTEKIILHPLGAYLLMSKLSTHSKELTDNILIEPDWRRPNANTSSWIWEREKVAKLANDMGVGICLDTSHTLISYQEENIAENLCKSFDFFQRSTKGVYSIHLSAAIPNSQNKMRVYTNSLGGLPLDHRYIPENVLEGFRIFHQHINHCGYNGTIVIELFRFPEGDTIRQREKAVYSTLETLFSKPKNSTSISIANSPTNKPI